MRRGAIAAGIPKGLRLLLAGRLHALSESLYVWNRTSYQRQPPLEQSSIKASPPLELFQYRPHDAVLDHAAKGRHAEAAVQSPDPALGQVPECRDRALAGKTGEGVALDPGLEQVQRVDEKLHNNRRVSDCASEARRPILAQLVRPQPEPQTKGIIALGMPNDFVGSSEYRDARNRVES